MLNLDTYSIMSPYLVWFALAVLLAGLEMLSGTFYLLLYGLACAIGGVIALLGLGDELQYAIAGLVAIAGTLWLRRRDFLKPAATSGSLDIGQKVEVESWRGEAAARVRYRGTRWDAELAPQLIGSPQAERPQVLYIVGQRGNTLIVAEAPPV